MLSQSMYSIYMEKKFFAQLIKMENWALKPCLIYEWCMLFHVAGDDKYREKLGRGERRGEVVKGFCEMRRGSLDRISLSYENNEVMDVGGHLMESHEGFLK